MDYMNSSFGIMLKILREIDKQMDLKKVDTSSFTHERLGITHERWARCLLLLLDAGYIKGITVTDNGWEEDDPLRDDNENRFFVDMYCPEITIEGLKFLAENTALARLYKTVKSVKDLVK